jgi:hypothetical protein
VDQKKCNKLGLLQIVLKAVVTKNKDYLPRLVVLDGLSNFIRSSAGGYFRGIPPAAGGPTTEVIGDQRVVTQAQADALSGVTKINGDLTISGSVTDLSPFDCLKVVTGLFRIQNIVLTEITGFGRLETIGAHFLIHVQSTATKISGFGSLKTIGKVVAIYNNNNLTEISGFGSLETIGATFAIYNNNNLTEISGFGSLETIGSNFEIENNGALTDASSLWNVTSVGNTFSCTDNTDFTNAAFATLVTSLKTIKGNINVNNNSGTNWTLPAVWTDGTELNWGVNTTNRKLNDATATDPGILGNFSVAARDELFDLPDKNDNPP